MEFLEFMMRKILLCKVLHEVLIVEVEGQDCSGLVLDLGALLLHCSS